MRPGSKPQGCAPLKATWTHTGLRPGSKPQGCVPLKATWTHTGMRPGSKPQGCAPLKATWTHTGMRPGSKPQGAFDLQPRGFIPDRAGSYRKATRQPGGMRAMERGGKWPHTHTPSPIWGWQTPTPSRSPKKQRGGGGPAAKSGGPYCKLFVYDKHTLNILRTHFNTKEMNNTFRLPLYSSLVFSFLLPLFFFAISYVYCQLSSARHPFVRLWTSNKLLEKHTMVLF